MKSVKVFLVLLHNGDEFSFPRAPYNVGYLKSFKSIERFLRRFFDSGIKSLSSI